MLQPFFAENAQASRCFRETLHFLRAGVPGVRARSCRDEHVLRGRCGAVGMRSSAGLRAVVSSSPRAARHAVSTRALLIRGSSERLLCLAPESARVAFGVEPHTRTGQRNRQRACETPYPWLDRRRAHRVEGHAHPLWALHRWNRRAFGHRYHACQSGPPMDTAILVASVGAATSLVAAVVASLQARRIARVTAQATLDVELARQAHSRWSEAAKVAGPHAQSLGCALAEAWEVLQRARDELKKAGSGARYDQDILSAQLVELSTQLENAYARHGAALPEPARRTWHHAKNLLAHAVAILPAHPGAIAPETRSLLLKMRDELSEPQESLANEQHRLVAQLIMQMNLVE
jgi:hypothetical protein